MNLIMSVINEVTYQEILPLINLKDKIMLRRRSDYNSENYDSQHEEIMRLIQEESDLDSRVLDIVLQKGIKHEDFFNFENGQIAYEDIHDTIYRLYPNIKEELGDLKDLIIHNATFIKLLPQYKKAITSLDIDDIILNHSQYGSQSQSLFRQKIPLDTYHRVLKKYLNIMQYCAVNGYSLYKSLH